MWINDNHKKEIKETIMRNNEIQTNKHKVLRGKTPKTGRKNHGADDLVLIMSIFKLQYHESINEKVQQLFEKSKFFLSDISPFSP